MGISYSILAASLWPLVAFLVPKKMLGTAYGFMQSIQNLGLAVMYVVLKIYFTTCEKNYHHFFFLFNRNIFTGLILDSYGYFVLEIFFILCLEVALLAAAFLYVYNSVKDGMLNDSPAVRQAKQQLLDGHVNDETKADANSASPSDEEDQRPIET